jgi:tetratricopeptide (TPR) repeat protein
MTSDATSTSDRESADSETVDAAVEAIAAGDLDQAESLLLGVIANTPSEYSNSEDSDEAISIKFWDQAEFIHYVTWQKKQGLANEGIKWIGHAYPRAHYYMGFVCVKRKQFDRAFDFLNKGQRLEPTNPKFAFEKAQALVHSGGKAEALSLYDQVTETGPHVSAYDLAVAQRGRGFVLIEMQDLDGAESTFKLSLEFEPDNDVALNELRYIARLPQGGAAAYPEPVASSGPNISKCAACGNQFDEGVAVSLNGMPVSIRRRCEHRFIKKMVAVLEIAWQNKSLNASGYLVGRSGDKLLEWFSAIWADT